MVKTSATDYATEWADVLTLTGTQTLTNKTLASAILTGSVTEGVFAIVDATSPALNPANGTIQTWVSASSTARTPSAALFLAGQSMTLMIRMPAVVTWPSVVWAGGAAPSIVTAGHTVIEFWKVGTTLYGAKVGDVA